ncbi:MAG TPA: DinB family protein [Candidatus Krumholzibacteria bacterium]|nr:DinB family protein [Candidatus Krumholzibacteria bacterium]
MAPATIPLEFTQRVLLRELRTLQAEIGAYPREADLWRVVPGISNPGGNLALHLCGNLQHYIGARLGNSGYVRDRAAEFSQRDVSRAEILRLVDMTIASVTAVLSRLDACALEADFPEAVGGFTVKTAEFLAHLASHLAYHLGQIDYHRRMTTQSPTTASAVPVAALASARTP